MPARPKSPKSRRNSSRECPTQVTCAIGSIPSSALTRVTTSIVRSRLDPPAPYVTDTKAGSSTRSASIVSMSFATPASVFGGKNSNEMKGSGRPSRAPIFMFSHHSTAHVRVPDAAGGVYSAA
jgi:hypothetical protein